MISIHAPRERCDRARRDRWAAISNFNPRTPREVRPQQQKIILELWHISIHAPRERCDCRPWAQSCQKQISIHAPRERCDVSSLLLRRSLENFNPRTPREVRLNGLKNDSGTSLFQSTHPARGATSPDVLAHVMKNISIHAPRERCDTIKLL